jgi:hypothetical protein
MTHQELATVFDTGDSYSVIEHIHRDGGTPIDIAKRYQDLANDLYWKSKHAPAAVGLSAGGITFCLTKATELAATDAAAAHALRDIAKQMAFNLASFAWPGWDEPGITLTPTEIRAGAEAAKLNLRLAKELNRPPKGMSNAYWMLGAYAVVDRRIDDAVAAFERAAELAEQVPDAAAAAMNRAYAAMARTLEKTSSSHDLERESNAAMERLTSLPGEDATFYAGQILTARRVFTAR